MAYRLTPAERRALAIARVNRDNPLINYYQDNSIMQEQEIQADRIQPQESDANALVRGVHTVGDIVGNVLTGALKGLEGIYDFGAGIVGGIGGIFDADFRDRVKEHVATDYVGNSVGNFLQDLTDQSYLKEGGFIENVAGGIGQMLPALAAAGITGGGSLVSLGTLGVSAAGSGTEEAFNDGAEYYRGLGYGAVRGATEIATEKLLGGADKLITGRGIFEGVKIAKQGLGRVVSEAINEGAEEVASELVNPLTRSIYKGTDAFKEYGDADYWKGVAEAGLVGGATSVAFGQTVGRMTGTSGKKGDINESLTEIKQANKKLANLQAEYNLTNDKRTKANEIIKGNWANIERTLQSVNADKRQALIKQFNLENEVNEDGTIKDTFKQSLAAEMPENDYYNQSVSLQGNAEKTNKDLGTIKQGMAKKLAETQGIDVQKASEMVGDISLFKGEMTDTEKQNRSKFMKSLNVLGKKGNAKLTFAILNPNEYFSANVTDGTLYIGADSFKTDQWAKDLVHEVTHLEEGTEEYNKLVQELSSGDILIDDGNGGKISLVEKATEKVLRKGYVNAQQLDEILKKANNNEMLTEQEREVFNLFKSELTAHESELYLGSEEFIDRIIASDTSLAKKIFDKIFNTKQALQKVDKNNVEVKRLLKAEKLWLDASKRIGNVQLAKYIQGKEKELEEKLQEGAENKESEVNLEETRDISFNLKYAEQHINKIKDAYEDTNNKPSVELETILERYDAIVKIWKELGGEINSDFLKQWDSKQGKDRAFTVFKAQAGYKYNIELSSMCKKGVPLFEAIDQIVKQEITNQLGLETIGKAEKEILYDILKKHNFEIPCAICYVEQARQREGVVIDAFLNGKREQNSKGKYTTYKLGWNEVLNDVQTEMKKLGVNYTFPSMDRSIATDNFEAPNFKMDEQTQNAFYEALKTVANKEIERYNVAEKKNRKYLRAITPQAIADVFKGTLPSNLKIFKTLFQNPTSRFRIQSDLLYSSLTTLNLASHYNAFYGLFNSQGGVSGYKTKQNTVVYWGDIISKTWDAAKTRTEGGIRYQSNSDSQIYTLIDQVQMYIDLTAKGYYLQAYTKVLHELKLFGLCNGKINASLIPKVKVYYLANGDVDIAKTMENAGLDENGNLLFDDIEGIDHAEAFMLIADKDYSKSVGGICIGYSDKHILKMLDDDRIQLIIGFHDKTNDGTKRYKGARYSKNYNGLNEATYIDNEGKEKTKHIGFNQYVKKAEGKFNYNEQTETYEGETTFNGKKYTANDIPRLAADMYLSFCDSKGYKPAYNDFKGHKNYYKLLADFSLYDSEGNYAPHKKVAYYMPDKVPYLDANGKKQYMSSKEYIKQELEKEMTLRDDLSVALADTSENGIIPQFVEAVKQKQSTSQFNLKSNPQISLSNGEIRKLVANYTRAKVYSRNETEMSINNLIEELGELFTTEKISLKGKSKEEAIQMLWQGLNSVDSQDRQAFAEKVAEYIIKNSIVESTYKDADYDYYADVYNVLHSYVQKFNLDHIKTEIEAKYGKAEAKSIIARWQSKDGTGMSVDGYAEDINELGFRIDETKEAEIFFAINDAYVKSLDKLKKEASTSFNEFLNDSEAVAIKERLTKEILDLFKTTGQISDKTKQRNAVSKLINNIVKKYNDKARRWRNKYKLLKETERATRTLVKKINKIAEFKEGVFWNATQYKTDAFKGSIEKLTKLIHNGNLNQSGTRDILKSFLEWYKKENPMLEGYFDESIAKAIDDLANNKKPLTDEEANLLEYLENKSGLTDINEIVKWYTLDNLHKKYDNFTKDWLKELASPKVFNLAEIKAMINFIDHVNHIAKDYKKVYRNGKLVDAQPLAEEYIKIIKKNAPVKVGWLQKFWRWYLKAFGDPMAYARYVDRYNGNGFYTEMLEKFRKASTDAAVMEMEFRKELDEFLDKHTKWQKNLKDRTVEYNGHEIPMVNAIALYMTLNREQALLGLAESGFVYKDKDGNKKDVSGFAVGQTQAMTMDELVELAEKEQAKIKKGFSETDLEYIAIVEKIFNEQCKKAKADADMKMRGYTNIIDGYYYPIMREGIADSVDTSTMFEVQNRVSNASFNKDTVKGAKQKLFIDNALTLADRHIKGISMYANLGAVVNEYDMLMNLDISGNPNNAVSIKTAGKDVIFQDANVYFKQMISDIQGIRDADTIFTKGLRTIRSNYVRFQLGANPKTLVTQLSSLFASTSILDYGSIVRGLGISGKDVDKYSPLAMLRNYDQSAYKAEGVLDKTGGIGDFLMKPIGMVDRFVITKLFGACQVQVEKNGGAKVGTEANKIEAGKLLEQVIYETQQNSLATERSAAMRSKNELVKGLVMFSSDAMKVAGRFIDSVGHYVTLKAQLKHTTVQAEIDAINKELKDAKKQLGKSTGALVTTSIFMALVAQAFRYAFAKDDEDDNVAVNMTVDAVGNLLGGLPLFKDAYSFIADGYDLDMYAYSTVNDFLGSIEKIMNIKWTDSRSITSSIKDLSFSLGQLTGVPTRNIYNTLYGLTKRFSPETAYKFDNMLYNQSYKADLEKAIENDDEGMISTIAGLMLDENIGGMNDADARHTMTDLIGKGYDILPRSVGDTISYDGETYELTNRQKQQFKKIYGASNEAVANMVKLDQFSKADDEVKAKAINYIYNVYYNLAIQDFLGVSIENKNILFAEAIDIEKLALISASANSIKADTDKSGKQISGSRKKKIQEYVNSLKMKAVEKFMVMGYLGYSNIYGENQVKSYINRLKLSKDEKSLLLEYSGYKTA